MKTKMRLDFAALAVASFAAQDGDVYGPASTTYTDSMNDPSCYRYCGPDDQHTGPTIPGAGC